MTPGSNLLEDAFDAIDTIEVQHLAYGSRVENAVGQWVTTYADPVVVEASVQAVPRSAYVELGLDFQKQFVQVFANISVNDVARDVTGDRFILDDGLLYQVASQIDWFTHDGWVGVLCVRVTGE